MMTTMNFYGQIQIIMVMELNIFTRGKFKTFMKQELLKQLRQQLLLQHRLHQSRRPLEHF